MLPLGVPEELHVAQQPSLADGQLCLSHKHPRLPDVGQSVRRMDISQATGSSSASEVLNLQMVMLDTSQAVKERHSYLRAQVAGQEVSSGVCNSSTRETVTGEDLANSCEYFPGRKQRLHHLEVKRLLVR